MNILSRSPDAFSFSTRPIFCSNPPPIAACTCTPFEVTFHCRSVQVAILTFTMVNHEVVRIGTFVRTRRVIEAGEALKMRTMQCESVFKICSCGTCMIEIIQGGDDMQESPKKFPGARLQLPKQVSTGWKHTKCCLTCLKALLWSVGSRTLLDSPPLWPQSRPLAACQPLAMAALLHARTVSRTKGG